MPLPPTTFPWFIVSHTEIQGSGIASGSKVAQLRMKKAKTQITAQSFNTNADAAVPKFDPWNVYVVGGQVSAPRLISSPPPEYTVEAREAHIEGTIHLLIIVRPDGTVADAKVQNLLGRKGLEESAIKAALRWRFEPSKRNGVPVAVQTNISMDFRLGK